MKVPQGLSRSASGRLALAGAIAALAVTAAPAFAEVRTVTSTADSGAGSLRDTVAAASAGDTIRVPAGTYVLASQIAINKTLTIDGDGAGATTVSGNDVTRIFSVSVGNLTISRLTLTRGRAPAGAISEGGAIEFTHAGALTIDRAALTDNAAVATAIGSGGAILSRGDVTVLDSTVSGNTADAPSISDGGAIYMFPMNADTAPRALVIRRSTFSANRAGVNGLGDGGAVYFGRNANNSDLNVTLSDSTFNGNKAGVSDNDRGSGGAFFIIPNSDGQRLNFDAQDVTFSGNEAGGTTGTSAGGMGGAVTALSGEAPAFDMAFTRVSFTGNRVNGSDADGGALAIGVFNAAATADVRLTNTTVHGNQASTASGTLGSGGGLYAVLGGSSAQQRVLVDSSTITSNSAPGPGEPGGGIHGRVSLKNTIVAGNTAAVGANCANGVTSRGYNIEDADTCTLNAAGDRKNTDPKLAPLGDNGGPTATRAPAADSPAVDGGDNTGCPAGDQRGVARPQGLLCDIGAVELRQADMALQQTAPQVVPTGGTISYTLAASNVGASAADAAQVRDQLPAGLTLVSATASTGACASAAALVTCSLGSLAPGASASIVIVAKSGNPGLVTNTAGVSTGSLDRNPANDSASATTTVDAPPSLSSFGVTKRFRVGRAATPRSAARKPRRGGAFTYTVSEPGVVTFAIARALPGRRSGRRCVAPRRRLARAKRCTRLVRAGTLTRRALAGRNRTAFSGRIGKKALKPGRYVVTLTARDSLGQTSNSRKAKFTIVQG